MTHFQVFPLDRIRLQGYLVFLQIEMWDVQRNLMEIYSRPTDNKSSETPDL